MKKVLALTLFAPLALFAADQPLPPAEKVMNHFIEASGGRAAFEKLTNQVQKGTVSFPAQGIKGTMTVYEAAPTNGRQVIEIPGVGKLEAGTSGDVAWENSVLQGARVKEGPEREEALRDSTFNSPLYWQRLYSKVEVVGAETVEGHDCYKLLLTPQTGHPTTEYYDKTSGLLIKSQGTRVSSMGEIAGEILYDDYRKEGDVLTAHKLTERFASQEFQVQFQTVELNAKLPPGIFDPPAEIQALLKKASAPVAKPAAPAPMPAGDDSGALTIYMGGNQVASEKYTVSRANGRIELNGSGSASIGPMRIDIEQFRVVTDEKFRPLQAISKQSMGSMRMNLDTAFADGKAKNKIDSGTGDPTTKEDPADADAIVVNANLPIYPWSILALRASLKDSTPQQFQVYVLGQGQVPATVVFQSREKVEFGGGKQAELSHLTITGSTPQGQPITLEFWVDDNRKVIKAAAPAQGVEAYQDGYTRKAPEPSPARQ